MCGRGKRWDKWRARRDGVLEDGAIKSRRLAKDYDRVRLKQQGRQGPTPRQGYDDVLFNSKSAIPGPDFRPLAPMAPTMPTVIGVQSPKRTRL